MTAPLVVVGDVLLDIDITGRSRRLCPDAPVPVIEQAEERPRPGGAGLAALLAAADGREVVLVTALADDDPGHRLRAMLAAHVEVAAFRLHGATPRKVRIHAEGQPVARLDVGEGRAVDGPVGPRIAQAVAGAGAVLVSDYGRGVTGHAAVRALLEEAGGRVPVVWDPHPRGDPPVPGTRLMTPNEDEAARLAAACGAAIDGGGLSAATRRARFLAETWRLDGVAVTLGADGALLVEGACGPRGAPFLAPAEPARGDSCGACAGPPSSSARAPRAPSPRGWPRPHRRASRPAATPTPGRWWSAPAARAAPSWRPAAASTCCTPGTSACCSRPAAWATAWSCA